MQPTGLLQNQRAVAVRRHDDPAEADRIHATGLVQAGNGIETIALKIGRMIEEPDFRAFRGEAIEVPGEPAQDVVGRPVDSTRARGDQWGFHVRERLAIEIVTLEDAGLIPGTQRKNGVLSPSGSRMRSLSRAS